MKSGWLIKTLLLAALLAFTGCEKPKPIEGVWELLSTTYTTPDTIIKHDQSNWKAIKTITKNYFSTVGHDPNRPNFGPVVTDADIVTAYNTFSGNGGKYLLKGDTYTEYLSFFTNPNRVNTSADLKYQIKGDTLVLNTVIGDVTWREVWRKVE